MRMARHAWVLGLALIGCGIDRAAATPANAPVIKGVALHSVNGLGVRIEAVAVHEIAGQPVLHGHVRADAQAGLSASRRVRIEVLDASGNVKRVAYERIDTQKPVRRSRLKERGGFTLALPELQSTDRGEISMVRAEEARAGH